MFVFAKKKIKQYLYSCLTPRYPTDYKAELDCINKINEVLCDKFIANNIDRCFWRSVAQHMAHSSFRPRASLFFVNIMSFFGLLFLLAKIKNGNTVSQFKLKSAYIKFDCEAAYIVPSQIKSCTKEVCVQQTYIKLSDLKFAYGLFLRHRVLNFELLFRFLLWVNRVRPILDLFEPEFILQYCEYSPHSSLRKAFLNANGVKLANVTHGEEYISTRSAFSTFDQYFHWDINNSNIYSSMKIYSDEWFPFNPTQHLKKARLPTKYVIGILWPSVLSADFDLLVQKINQIANNFQVLVRPHPNPRYRYRFDDFVDKINADISDSQIEDPHSFIDRTSIICGYASAIIIQAALRGRRVVYINDGFLESLVQYHPFYQNAERISLPCLNDLIYQQQSSI